MIGRRRPDTLHGDLPDDLQVGDYWLVLNAGTGEPIVVTDEPGKLTPHVWMVCCPRPDYVGGPTFLLANLWNHTVREHEDGTISVRAGDGSSNSILVSGRWAGTTQTWHGYIEHGEFLPV